MACERTSKRVAKLASRQMKSRKVSNRSVDSRRGEGWVRLDELESAVTECRSVGWVVAKDKHSLTLAGHIGENPAQCCGDVTIPRRAISKITELSYS